MLSDEYPSAVIATMVVPAFLVVLGMMGNIVTLGALSRDDVLTSGAKTYLTLLTTADLLGVLVCVGRFWLTALTRSDVSADTPVMCQLLPWMDATLLMLPAWILVALTLQVYQGLRMPVNRGNNLTPWKSRVFAGSAFLFCGLFNAHSLFMFVAPDDAQISGEGETVLPLNATTNLTVTVVPTYNSSHACVPQPGVYAKFYHEVWPYMSVCASVVQPLGCVLVLLPLIVRLLFSTSRANQVSAPPPEWFRTLVITVLFLCVSTFLLSAGLAGISVTEPWRFWTGYIQTLLQKDWWKEVELDVWVVLRHLFYLLFCGRWIITCCCCKLWGRIGICRPSET